MFVLLDVIPVCGDGERSLTEASEGHGPVGGGIKFISHSGIWDSRIIGISTVKADPLLSPKENTLMLP